VRVCRLTDGTLCGPEQASYTQPLILRVWLIKMRRLFALVGRKACVAGVNGSPSLAFGSPGMTPSSTVQCHSRPERSGGEGNPWLGTMPPFPFPPQVGCSRLAQEDAHLGQARDGWGGEQGAPSLPDLRKERPITRDLGKEGLSRLMSQPLRMRREFRPSPGLTSPAAWRAGSAARSGGPRAMGAWGIARACRPAPPPRSRARSPAGRG
jgi:hypothetical protein